MFLEIADAGILSNENLFLIILGLVWIIGAVLQDLRRREVDNIWNFSLIAFALGYRSVVSVYTFDPWFLLNGLIGFGIFLILGNLFYYSRIFAGGDTKLLIALGPVLTLSFDWIVNLKIYALFTLGFLLGGSIYVFIWALVLAGLKFGEFRKEFVKQWGRGKLVYNVFLGVGLVVLLFSFFIGLEIALISLIFLLFPVLFVFAKAVEECCMVRDVSVDKITVGDWLYEDVYIKGKRIKAHWEGVSSGDLKLIQEKYRRKIKVKYGVPFTPGFLIGLLVVLWFGGFKVF